MGVVPDALHRFIAAPAIGTGVWDHDIVRVLVGFVPRHEPLPVTVRVAVNDPLVTEGVNVARAGLIFCVHAPRPPPPLHVVALNVPVAEAPVIAIAASGVASQRLKAPPAVAVGTGLTVRSAGLE
jgi:hypothetical protein